MVWSVPMGSRSVSGISSFRVKYLRGEQTQYTYTVQAPISLANPYTWLQSKTLLFDPNSRCQYTSHHVIW